MDIGLVSDQLTACSPLEASLAGSVESVALVLMIWGCAVLLTWLCSADGVSGVAVVRIEHVSKGTNSFSVC